MPDLLTCVTIGARILTLTAAILASLKLLLNGIRGHEIPRGECAACAVSSALFVGLMGWLN